MDCTGILIGSYLWDIEDGRIDDVTIIDFAFFCVNPLAPKSD